MTTDGRSVGVAIVGCGVIAPTHAGAAIENGARIVATYDAMPERAAALAARFGGRPAGSLEDLLGDPEVDLVSVCTPSGAHLDAAVAAARAGKHLFVEKPLEVTLERAREIVRVAADAGVVLSVVSQHRFDDSTLAAKRAIDSGRLGRIVLAGAQVLWHRSQAYYDGDGWRGTLRLDGGGALMNQGIHSVDLLRYLAGDVESLSGRIALLGHAGLEVEDVAVATLRFTSGALGMLVGTTSAPPGFGARIEVYGDRGAVRIEDDRLAYLTEAASPPPGERGPAADAADAGDRSAAEPGAAADPRDRSSAAPASAAGRPDAIRPEGHARQLADVLAAIELGRAPEVDGYEGLKALELVLAVYEASRTGAEVRLPLA